MRHSQEGKALHWIIGILSLCLAAMLLTVVWLAFPDYTERAQVTEGLSVAAAGKTAVSEFFSNNMSFPRNNEQAGLVEDVSGEHVRSVVVHYGVITVTFAGNPDFEGDTIILTPIVAEGGITWDCTGGSLPQEHRPSSCRSRR